MDFLAGQQVLLAGDHADATPADNTTATATATPASTSSGRGRLILLSVTANYTATVSAVADITVTYTRPGAAATNTITISHDFSAGAFGLAFPAPLTCERGTTAVATLGASGTPGVSGRITLWYCQT